MARTQPVIHTASSCFGSSFIAVIVAHKNLEAKIVVGNRAYHSLSSYSRYGMGISHSLS